LRWRTHWQEDFFPLRHDQILAKLRSHLGRFTTETFANVLTRHQLRHYHGQCRNIVNRYETSINTVIY
jgi:hypothetical protein